MEIAYFVIECFSYRDEMIEKWLQYFFGRKKKQKGYPKMKQASYKIYLWPPKRPNFACEEI